MKKTIAILLALLLCLTAFGCGKDAGDGDETEPTNGITPIGEDTNASKPSDDADAAEPSKDADGTEPSGDEGSTQPLNKLESLIYSELMQESVATDDERFSIALTVENGDTVVVATKLKDSVTPELQQQYAEETAKRNNTEDMYEGFGPLVNMISQMGVADSVKLCIRVISSDGKTLTEYTNTLHADGAGEEEPSEKDTEPADVSSLESIINSSFIQQMLEETADDEMEMRLRAEGDDVLVLEAQLKNTLSPEEEQQMADEFKTDMEGHGRDDDGVGAFLDLIGAMAGVDHLKCVIRMLNAEGKLLSEYTID